MSEHDIQDKIGSEKQNISNKCKPSSQSTINLAWNIKTIAVIIIFFAMIGVGVAYTSTLSDTSLKVPSVNRIWYVDTGNFTDVATKINGASFGDTVIASGSFTATDAIYRKTGVTLDFRGATFTSSANTTSIGIVYPSGNIYGLDFLPNFVGYNNTAIYLSGTNVAHIYASQISCGASTTSQAIKLNGSELDNTIYFDQIGNCKQAVNFTANLNDMIQGNLIQGNFITTTTNAWNFNSQSGHPAWDSNSLIMQAYDANIANAVALETNGNQVDRETFFVNNWFGGFSGTYKYINASNANYMNIYLAFADPTYLSSNTVLAGVQNQINGVGLAGNATGYIDFSPSATSTGILLHGTNNPRISLVSNQATIQYNMWVNAWGNGANTGAIIGSTQNAVGGRILSAQYNVPMGADNLPSGGGTDAFVVYDNGSIYSSKLAGCLNKYANGTVYVGAC